jgi:hypothetical protein
MTRMVMVVAAAALLVGLAPAAQARKGFARLPALGRQGQSLRIRIVGYKGGKMHVQVRNIGATPATFKADGLYFVPEGDPARAPQRMGAAGPMEVALGGAWQRKQAHRISARGIATIRLDVFCLDSHRSGPSDGQAFSVARRRLPKALRRRIVEGTSRIYSRARRAKRPARGAIQSYIWKTRNARWIKLQGERRREKVAPGRRFRHRYPSRRRRFPHRYRRYKLPAR